MRLYLDLFLNPDSFTVHNILDDRGLRERFRQVSTLGLIHHWLRLQMCCGNTRFLLFEELLSNAIIVLRFK